MKASYLISLIALFAYSASFAQYEYGDIDISVGSGFGVYSASSNDPQDSSNSGAANTLINFTINYALMENLSVGYNFERNIFLLVDSANKADGGYANSNNFKLNVIYRLVNGEKSALGVEGIVGLSMLQVGAEVTDQKVKSNGMTWGMNLAWQRYFGEHFGFFLSGGYTSYTYKKLTDQDGDVWETSDGNSNFKLILSGGNVRGGLVYKI